MNHYTKEISRKAITSTLIGGVVAAYWGCLF
jgi:hypothetical protein